MDSIGVKASGLILVLGGIGLFRATGTVKAATFFTPFVLGPVIVLALSAMVLKSRAAQIALAMGGAAYALGTSLTWLFISFGRPSRSTDAIALMFSGLHPSALLMISWIVAVLLNLKSQ